MALEVLAGPYPITTDGGTAIDSFSNSDGMDAVYVQGIGLYGNLTPHGETPEYCAVQWDGTAARRGWHSDRVPLMLNLRDGGFALRGINTISKFDILAAREEPTPFYTAASFVSGQVICADRYLRFNLGMVESSADAMTWTTEHTWSGAAPGSGNTVSDGGAPNVLCVSFTSSGQIRFYDVLRKVQVGNTRFVGEANQGVWYIAKYGVFLELVSKQIKILADAPRPASIANPAALATVQAGRAVQVRTQVLGAQSEPCAGELVNWSISAGAGSLEQAQTETDADGYAFNVLTSPVGSSGGVTVQAEVAF
jgi:hypothetical protein